MGVGYDNGLSKLFPNSGKTGVIVVDMQQEFLKDVHPEQQVSLLQNHAELLRICRALRVPVACAIWKDGQPHKALKEVRYRKFEKNNWSAFTNPKLQGWFERKGVSNLIVTGIYTSSCVQSTAVHAQKLDFEVATIGDCISDGLTTNVRNTWNPNDGVYLPTYKHAIPLLERNLR